MNDAEKIIRHNLGYKPGEKILIITDTELKSIGEMFYDAALSLNADAVITIITPGKENGEEPPSLIAEAMKYADIIIMPTLKSLSHTSARREACEKGARVASMPGITLPIFKRMLSVDYAKMQKTTKKIADKLRNSSYVKIKTDLGTDLSMVIKNREVYEDNGILNKKGDFGNLPAGEADLSPSEGTTQGSVIIDGSALMRKVKNPIKVIVEKGYAVKFEGDELAKELEKTLARYGKDAFNIAELGIGTNDRAIITGNILEDEKVYSTCHIAFGNNKSYGGKIDIPIHLDCIIKEPNIYCDNELIIKKGKLVI
ncbi:aminopeptidase [Candidatus Woesearchaeota archaeon]|nr:aminopeptidase [Candidatus Woesearchaeota archaeon]